MTGPGLQLAALLLLASAPEGPGSAQPLAAPLLRTTPAAAGAAAAAGEPEAAAEPTEADLPGWHERGLGLQLEGGFAALFRDDPQGSAFASDEAYGARLSFDVGRLVAAPLGLPARLGLTLGLLWYHADLPSTDGTRAVQVLTSFDYLALPLQGGFELGSDSWRLVPYLVAGPAFTRVAVDYRIEDPVGVAAGLAPDERSLSSFLPGAAYGGGVSFGWRGAAAALGITGRIELLRFRRGPNDDLSVGFALGLLL